MYEAVRPARKVRESINNAGNYKYVMHYTYNTIQLRSTKYSVNYSVNGAMNVIV